LVADQWIDVFRKKALTIPWSEDWIWQSPVGTQQMMQLSIDAMRSGIFWADEPDKVPEHMRNMTKIAQGPYAYRRLPPPHQRHQSMLMYVMHHFPGNTNSSWQRQLFADIAHGVDRFNLFHLVPSTSGYTCDYVDGDGGAYPAVRQALSELGNFEDIVQEGTPWPQGAAVSILYSESADIWLSAVGTFGSGLRSLYIALRHAQLPVTILTEDDCVSGRLFFTDMLVVTVPNIGAAATAAISAWVSQGGIVVATASGGLLDEYNQTNHGMQSLLGVQQSGVWRGSQGNGTIDIIKQDLNFVDSLGNVTVSHSVLMELQWQGSDSSLVCKGAKSIITVTRQLATQIFAHFDDGSPAAVRSRVGVGQALYFAFLPGLSYFDPAIPLRPVDRGSTDENFNHFLPTEFATLARELLTLPLKHRMSNDSTVVPVRSTNPLVEVGFVVAEGIGMALPCINWAGIPESNFTVTLTDAVRFDSASLASERPLMISMDRLSFTFDLPATTEVLILRQHTKLQ
jgi:hypothetical protein